MGEVLKIENYDVVLNNMSDEELKLLNEKAMIRRLNSASSKIIKLEDGIKKVNRRLQVVEDENKLSKEKHENNKKELKRIKDKIDTLENDETGKYNTYKKCAKHRVFQLVGKKGTCKYILFYDSFILKLHNHVASSLNVSRTGKIKVEDYEGALALARRWYPSKKYLSDKIKEYLKLSDKKKNTENEKKKINALNEFMELIEGDIYSYEF